MAKAARVVLAGLAGAATGYAVLEAILVVGFSLTTPSTSTDGATWNALFLVFLIPIGGIVGMRLHMRLSIRAWVLLGLIALALGALMYQVLEAVLN